MTTARVEIENEVLKWSSAERVGLAERLLESVTDFATEDIGQAWRLEIARRVGEVESGKVSEIPSREDFSKARNQLNGVCDRKVTWGGGKRILRESESI
jgi:putative addiction module component (TIGR02574 family)